MTSNVDLRQWEIPQVAEFKEGSGGLMYLDVKSNLASACIFLHGAHVTHFQPRGEKPVLFLSEKSQFAPGKAIRGGVPVIFPWFGPRAGFPDAPAHGFARTQSWQFESLNQNDAGEITVTLRLESSEHTRSQWAYDFRLTHGIKIGSTLSMLLSVENRSPETFTFEEALHTYLAVADVRELSVTGLEGVEYLDKVGDTRRRTKEDQIIRFTGETDRIYLNTESTCIATDPKLQRQIHVSKEGSRTTVVWNPWIAKAAALPDFGDDEWPHMLCIETTNAAENAVSLQPGEKHSMRATVGVHAAP